MILNSATRYRNQREGRNECDEGRCPTGSVRRTLAGLPLPRAADDRPVLAVDVSPWLRPDAATAPDRSFCHTYGRGGRRRRHCRPTPLRSRGVLAAGRWREGDPEILAVLDAGSDAPRIHHLLAGLPVQILGRLRSDRVMRRTAARSSPWPTRQGAGRAESNKLTPARVRRGFRNLHLQSPTPARAPKPFRPGPGRLSNDRPGRDRGRRGLRRRGGGLRLLAPASLRTEPAYACRPRASPRPGGPSGEHQHVSRPLQRRECLPHRGAGRAEITDEGDHQVSR